MAFTKNSDFHWNLKRIGFGRDVTKADIEDIIKVLNTLTPEQEKAVRFFGYSRYEEGYDSGANGE